MKMKYFISELKSGAEAYASAYHVVKKSYPTFTLSFISVSLLFILTSVLSALLPFLLKKTAEAYTISEGLLSAFFWITMTYAICWTVTEILKNIKGIFSAGILARSDAALTDRAMDVKLAMCFQKQKLFEPAVLAANIDRGAKSFSALTISVFWTLFPVFIEIAVAIFFLYQTLGIAYSLLFSISVIGMIFLAFSIAMLSQHIHTDIMHAQNRVYSYTVERLSMPLDIRVNVAHSKESVIRQDRLSHYVETIKSTNKKMGVLLSLQAAVIGALLAVSVLVLVFFRDSSHIGTGDFIMIVGYIGMLTFQLRTVAGAGIDIQRQVVFMKLLIQYFNEPQEGVVADSRFFDEKAGYIFEARDVKADLYNRTLFSGVSFKVKRGEMFALSAPSGFGKSTLLGYLLGLENPAEGHIYFQGSLIDSTMSSALLKQVAVVPQRAALIEGTVRDNILYGTEKNLSDDELYELLKALELATDSNKDESVRLLNRNVNPQGGGLSGGEMQRICIGRALARKTQIIVLDEPTASIGEEQAIRIVNYIRGKCQTVLITTHNPRILAMADSFYQGKVAQVA